MSIRKINCLAVKSRDVTKHSQGDGLYATITCEMSKEHPEEILPWSVNFFRVRNGREKWECTSHNPPAALVQHQVIKTVFLLDIGDVPMQALTALLDRENIKLVEEAHAA